MRDDRAFETIAAFGEHAAEPHHHPTDRALRRGDVVKLDFGAVVDGYHSDMTRTVAFGEPDPRIREVRDLVAAAQEAGIAAVHAGASAADVDLAARRVIEDAGLGKEFPHGLGHGVGLEIHEAPRVRWDVPDDLPEGIGRHGRARRVHSGPRGRPHRGHGRGDRRRMPPDPAVDQGTGGAVSVSTNDLKNGMTLELDGTLFQVVEFQHVKPGKGGAFVRTKLRNLKTGGVVERTFNAG